MAGSNGLDLVVPLASFLERQLTAGGFQTPDKSQSPEWIQLYPETPTVVAQHELRQKSVIT
ncbi:putrescine ABC transporter periplasmic binding protein [Escherichia coli]|nr:putrescine ABC transporter periplasmic binding protein [Escherichia coli]